VLVSHIIKALKLDQLILRDQVELFLAVKPTTSKLVPSAVRVKMYVEQPASRSSETYLTKLEEERM